MRLTATFLAGALVVGTLAAPAPILHPKQDAFDYAKLAAQDKLAKEAKTPEKIHLGLAGHVGPVISKEEAHKAPKNAKTYIVGWGVTPKEAANRTSDRPTKAYKGPKAGRFLEIVTKLPGKIHALSQKGAKKLFGLHRDATAQIEGAHSKFKAPHRSERSQKSETSAKPKKEAFLYSDVAAPELTRPSLNKTKDKPENKHKNKPEHKQENKPKHKHGIKPERKVEHKPDENKHESNRESSNRENNHEHNHEHNHVNNLESRPEINHESKPHSKHGGRAEINIKPKGDLDRDAMVKHLVEKVEHLVATAEHQSSKRRLGDGKTKSDPPSSTITNLDHEVVDKMFRTPEESTERHHLRPAHGVGGW